jgi:electron transport complex protein RnfG
MKFIFKLAAILGTTCIIAAFSLGGVFEITKARIAAERAKVLEEALSLVLPDAKKIVPTNDASGKKYYRGYATEDTTQAPIGYSIIAYGKGYSSTIQILTGVDLTGTIVGIKVLFQQETPGLGTKSQEVLYDESDPWFQRQYLKKSGLSIAVDKDGGTIKSITGATITSRAITNAIRKEIEWLKEKGLLKSAEITKAVSDTTALLPVKIFK